MAEAPEKDPETLDGGGERPDAEAKAKAEPSPGEASSDSSSDSEAEDVQELQLEALERALSENPTNYDAHVQYIQCLRKLGDIEKLHRARKTMNEVFPLSPSMWQEWAKDEASLTEGSDFSGIVEIYEKGIHEYLSVSLWCDYLNFVQENDRLVAQCAPAGVSKMRDLFERALTAAGLHVSEGNTIWEAYREFEQAIYLTIDENNTEERERQLSRVRSLFQRQLAVPLADMGFLLVSYKSWESEQGNTVEDELNGIPANVASSYKKALEMYNARAPYEDQLSKQDVLESDKLQYFMNYIKMEESLGDPVRVQIIYERAVSAFPVSADLWLGYTSYLDKTLKVSTVLKNVYSRATRNCPWVGDLWVRYLLSLERVHASEQEICCVFEKSLQFAFTSIDEYLNLFLTRIDGLRRRISSAVANEALEFTLLRETFQHASDYLSPQLTNMEDLLHLHSYWTRLEVTLGKDLAAARGVWENLIKQSGLEYEVWKRYIAMEIELGHINDARAIYKRCYSKRFNENGSEEVCRSWLRFEREYGSLDELDIARKKVMPRLEELKLFRAQQESRNVAASKDVPESKKDAKKRKINKAQSDNQSPAKRPKDGQENPDEPSQGSSDAHGTKAGSKAGDFTSEENFVYKDQCTAFVSNLSLKVNEEHLRRFFNPDGGISAIRLLRDKFTGKSRGLAYVDFLGEEHLSAAIAKNKQKLLGNKISIVRSDPKRSKKASGVSGGQMPSDSMGAKDAAEGVEKDPRARCDREAVTSHRRGGHVQLKGRNTFAVPRSVVKPLGWSSSSSKPVGDEQPKSNAEFKDMLLKK